MAKSLHSHFDQWKAFFNTLDFKPNEYLLHFGVKESSIQHYFIQEVKRLLDNGAFNITVQDGHKSLGFAVFRKSTFDSNVLNRKVGKVDYIAYSPEISEKKLTQLVSRLISSFKSADLDYVTCRVPARNLRLIHELEKMGFVIVDQYLVMLKDMEDQLVKSQEDLTIRPADESDIIELQESIAPTFRYSRFFRDNILSEDSAIRMHAEWIKNSVLKKVADCVFVADIEKVPVGFVSVEVDGDIEEHLGIKIGHIPLIGINPVYRGRKLGQLLTQYVIDHWFKKEAVRYVRIETQLINTPATRTYENMGFRLVDAAITLRWKND